MLRRLFLYFRYLPEADDENATEEVRELRAELRENEREVRAELLDISEDPSYEIYKRTSDALGWLSEWETYEHKFPYSGGLWDQPAIWKMGLDAAIYARSRSDKERKREKEEQDSLVAKDE